MIVRTYHSSDCSEWLRMRETLWPDAPNAHLASMEAWLARLDTTVLVAAQEGSNRLVGFAEVGARSVADGCETSPVAYLEGWYVDPDLRRKGVGTALVRAAETWARAHGYREFASDVELHNVVSQQAHVVLGFTEVGRSVVYRKEL